MAGPKININRYRLITLLYVIFVCLSVLNIPVSLLDSNYHLIKTLEYQEESRLKDVAFANEVIAGQDQTKFNDTARTYLDIRDSIHKCYVVIDQVDSAILKKFAALNTSLDKEFNSKRKIEEILVKDSLIVRMRGALFGLVSFLESKPMQLDSSIKMLTPVIPMVKTRSSSSDMEWDRYLFLHKPTAISYMQIKRIKVLLLDNEFLYQNAALRMVHFIPAYHSESTQQTFIRHDAVHVSAPTPVANEEQDSSSQARANSKEKAVLDSMRNAATQFMQKISRLETEKANERQNVLKEFDNFFQQVVAAMHAEHLYVGITNPLLQNFGYELGRDFTLEISPAANIARDKKDLNVVFRTPGDYKLRFTDLRGGDGKFIFERKVHVSLLPNPVVKLSGDNNLKDLISVRDLFVANRLVASVNANDIDYFPGRITGYRVSRITKTKEEISVYNYGEVFQAGTQQLLKSLIKGDLLLFDRLTLAMQDGTTRSSNSIVYKIDE